jgi:hypothetical protein
MYFLGGLSSETFDSSNGTFGGDVMPVVFWEEKMKVLNLTSVITLPDETTVSLVDDYREWKKNN